MRASHIRSLPEIAPPFPTTMAASGPTNPTVTEQDKTYLHKPVGWWKEKLRFATVLSSNLMTHVHLMPSHCKPAGIWAYKPCSYHLPWPPSAGHTSLANEKKTLLSCDFYPWENGGVKSGLWFPLGNIRRIYPDLKLPHRRRTLISRKKLINDPENTKNVNIWECSQVGLPKVPVNQDCTDLTSFNWQELGPVA